MGDSQKVWEIKESKHTIQKAIRTSLVVQGLRSHLPPQEPWIQPCSRKPPRAAGQLSPCATTPEPTLCNYWSLSALELVLHSTKATTTGSPHRSPRQSIRKHTSVLNRHVRPGNLNAYIQNISSKSSRTYSCQVHLWQSPRQIIYLGHNTALSKLKTEITSSIFSSHRGSCNWRADPPPQLEKALGQQRSPRAAINK